MQLYTVYSTCKLPYMFRVVSPPIIRSTNNCIYSIWYWSTVAATGRYRGGVETSLPIRKKELRLVETSLRIRKEELRLVETSLRIRKEELRLVETSLRIRKEGLRLVCVYARRS